MNKLYTYLLSVLGILASLGPIEASENLQEKVKAYEDFQIKNYQELVYLQTDKQYYLTGERIGFKVFCLEKNSAKPSQLSKVGYFEVLNQNNVPQLQAKIELRNGSGYGEVFIPTNINSGNYILRGYTRWMRNFGPESFFYAKITIINPFKRLELQPIPKAEDISINFFPESGTLINRVKTKVVYDCKDINGYLAEYSGKLFSNDSVLVCEFKPLKNGLGNFDFTPDIFNKYHVQLLHKDSSVTTHKFLPIQGKGFSMQVLEKKNEYEVEVFCNDPEIVQPSEIVYFMLHQKGKIIEKNNVALSRGEFSFQIDKSKLDKGIVTITLFTSEGKFLKQRKLVNYKSKEEYIVKINKKEFEQREKATIDLTDFINSEYPENIDLAVSVSARHQNIVHRQMGIDDYLLLENSIVGVTCQIGDVLNGPEEIVSKRLNDLLIANSTIDTLWQSLVRGEVSFIPEYRTPLITGKVTNKLTKEPARGIFAYISIPGKYVQFNATRSKSNGEIIFEMENFYGSNEIIVQTDYSKDTIYSIEIDNPFSQEYADIKLPVFNIDEHLENWIRQQSQNMQVRNAYRRYQPKSPIINVIDTSSFYNEPDATYFLDDYTRFIVMEEVMREYISGVNVRKNKDGFHFMVIDYDRNEIFSENPLMLYDGVPVFDADEIIALDPMKVEKIETIKRRFHKGYLDCRGIVNFTSYKGDLPGYTLNKNAFVIKYDGIQTSKQYSFPQYATAMEKRDTAPDFRNVLYWLPSINLNKTQNEILEFYTSDEANNYEIVINGISENGTPYSGKAFFQVNPTKSN